MSKTIRSFFFSIVWILSFLQIGFAQTEITGKVIDKDTGEPIPYCNISLQSSSLGTASNELGEFIIEADSLPVKLIFSHLNYELKAIENSKTFNITVSLEPLTTTLDEVIVSATKIDQFAMKLAKSAIEKAFKASTKDNYGRAFYRQKSKNGDAYSEFSEIFYDIRYNNVGIKDWNISEGRYALNEDAVRNRNYTSFSRILKPLQPNTEDLIFPLHPNFEVYYNPRIISMIQSGNSKIAVVHFKPLKNLKTPAFDGEVYIDTKTFDILKIKYELSNDNLKFAKLSTTKKSHWKEYTLSYELAYRKDHTSKSLLDYIKVDQSFDYYVEDRFQYHTTSTSNLIFYEHYTPTSRKRLGGRLSRTQSDWRKLDAIGYNETFWAENPIVKRTPVEEEVINSFEKENAFSSIFLNSAENIALMTSNIAEDPFIKELDRKTINHNNYNPIEKVFLHTDKDLFSAGETIWYSPYVVAGPYHQPSNGSRVVYVDLISPDGKIALSQTHEIITGMGSGSMELPKSLPSGNYQLRSYTQWMRNFAADFFFTKNLTIMNENNMAETSLIEDKIDLQFFPEGGHMIADIVSKISFKAIGSDGLPRNAKGRIIDSGGLPVAAFSTFDRGAGFFQLMPKKDEQYLAELDDGTQYPLPKVLENGYIVLVNNLNEKSIKIIVQASEPLRDKPFYVIGNMRQRKYYQGKFEFGLNRTFTFEIPKTQMPSGVLTLTLFDSNKKPWCERPVFVNNQEELVINTKVNSNNLVKRGKVTIDINVTDTEGKSVSTNLSMAVTDADQVEKNQNSGTILSQFLLESDIKGNVTEPGLLFIDQKRTTIQKLDLVMLTHGWRKYNWPEVWEERITAKEFDFSEGLIISGKATKPNNKVLSNASLNVIAQSKEKLGMLSAKTALDGTFSIRDFNFNGPTKVVFNAFDVKDNPLNVKVTLDPKKKVNLPIPTYTSPRIKLSEEIENYSTHSVARSRMESLYEKVKVTELDEVVVTEKKKENSRNQTPSVYGQRPDATLYTADFIAAQTVLQMVGLFNGVTVNGNTVSIRNRGTPLWVLDGIPVYNDNPSALSSAGAAQNTATEARRSAGSALPAPLVYSIAQATAPGPVPSFIATMDTFTIERIEILKGPSAAIYGSRGGNGVILIYTKRGEGQTIKPLLSPDFTISGHAAEKEFYSPKYNVRKDEHSAPDYRATLYWDPNIMTDENGNAKIEFFNSDAAEEIQISIEGLSLSGVPGSYLETLGN